MDKRNIGLWVLYDFANSFLTIVFFLYLGQWLVIDHGVSDLTYNLIFVGSTLLILLTTPVSGRLADRWGIRLTLLRITTCLMFLAFLGASLLTSFAGTLVVWVLVAYMFGTYFYQFSISLYNPLLHDIAPARLQGRISGFGEAANWTGQVVGLLVTLPFVAGAWYLAGEVGRSQAFLPATLLFFVFALPFLLFFKDPVRERSLQPKHIWAEYKSFVQSFRDLLRAPGVGRFLLGCFLFNDALVTAVTNFPIFLERVYDISDAQKSLLLMGTLATCAIGALIGGWVGDKFGLKRTLLAVLFGWVIIFPLTAWAPTVTLFAAGLFIIGLLFGAECAVVRATMSYLSPPGKVNYAFSFYTLTERLGSFIGPLSWGLLASLLVSLGPMRYRISLTIMAVFILLGFLVIRKIPMPKGPAVERR